MNHTTVPVEKATVLFAGDSGDGIQLAGNQFSHTAARHGNDLSTFPDYPAEIRAPIGTLAGVSGFKINFGGVPVHTPGGEADVLVAMNAAALEKNLKYLKKRGIIIVNTAGFDRRNLKLAGIDEKDNPLESPSVKEDYQLISIDITKLTREALKDSSLGTKDKDRSRNMFVLGYIYWLYNRDPRHTIEFLRERFRHQPEVRDANVTVLKAGYSYGDTTETFSSRFEVEAAQMPPGQYRSVIGSQAMATGLIAAAAKAHISLFYAGYPITPASDILHELSRHKNFGVLTFQAEDEIAAVTAAIGASFGGRLGVTASSGPGISLKTEALGLAVMLELPLVIINVQRGGPSTGLPTKTEQADLLQAFYGRNGEAPMPVLAASSPADCFRTAFEACKIAVEHMTPVMLLSDGYIANGAEPWKFPSASELEEINPPLPEAEKREEYQPYLRDKKGVRPWAIPGMKGFEHRIGGLEKEVLTGNVSYEPENHQKMVDARAEKVEQIASELPAVTLDSGKNKGKLLVVSWGSTLGVVKTTAAKLRSEELDISHCHLRHLNPLPLGMKELLGGFETVLVPELNKGQLVRILRDRFLVDARGINKVQGQPFLASELEVEFRKALEK